MEEKPDKKQYILKYMKEALESIVQKEALSYTFVHNLFYEYLTYADDIERQVSSLCSGLDRCQSGLFYLILMYSLKYLKFQQSNDLMK